MATSSESAELLVELYERSSIVTELDGPQIEAWVSGLFPLFDQDVPVERLVDLCASHQTPHGALVCLAIAELAEGLDGSLAKHAAASVPAPALLVGGHQVGHSVLADAWRVEAPFGRSIVLGYDHPLGSHGDAGAGEGSDDEPPDLRHSVLVEVSDEGHLEDLQLTGPPQVLLDDAAASDDRVVVTPLEIEDAMAAVVAAWPTDGQVPAGFGPGLVANQQFVRRRVLVATGVVLPRFSLAEAAVDVSRGLDEHEFAAANQAARSTLQAAVGGSDAASTSRRGSAIHEAWVGVIRGDGGDVSPRERDALLWLEWADWLGAGIGLLRSGPGAAADGAAMVDYVNRCPEVSSTIDKADRDYAEWAFATAIDLLADAGAIEDGVLTQAGHDALAAALVTAWT